VLFSFFPHPFCTVPPPNFSLPGRSVPGSRWSPPSCSQQPTTPCNQSINILIGFPCPPNTCIQHSLSFPYLFVKKIYLLIPVSPIAQLRYFPLPLPHFGQSFFLAPCFFNPYHHFFLFFFSPVRNGADFLTFFPLSSRL